ncbi:MAG: manganese catalase family protein [Bacilli bacterium]
MFKYEKKLNYPINIKTKDLKMAKYLMAQFGGANSELSAALRYFSQKFTMPDEKGKSLLNDISCEELGHCEMISSMINQLIKGATIEEMEAAGLGGYYSEHGKGLYPVNADGVPFSAAYFTSTGDVIADLEEDMAAEEKARATYENLIDLANSDDVIGPLLFLRQREIVHFNRFKELRDYYKEKLFNNC